MHANESVIFEYVESAVGQIYYYFSVKGIYCLEIHGHNHTSKICAARVSCNRKSFCGRKKHAYQYISINFRNKYIKLMIQNRKKTSLLWWNFSSLLFKHYLHNSIWILLLAHLWYFCVSCIVATLFFIYMYTFPFIAVFRNSPVSSTERRL